MPVFERQLLPDPDPPPQRGAALRQGAILTASLLVSFGLLAAVWLFARPLAVVGVAIVVGEALRPLVERASRGFPRPLAVASVYLTLAVVVGTALWFALAPLVGQAQLLIDSLPTLIAQAQAWLERQDQQVTDIPLVDSLAAQLQGLAGQLLTLPLTLVSSLFELVLIVFLSLYWLLASPALGRFVRSLFPAARRERVAEVQAELSRTTGGYFRGVAINVVLVAIVTYIGLRLIGLPFPLVFAVIAGLFEIIPIVGPFLAGAIIIAFALSQSWQVAVITLLFFVALQQLEGNVLTPMVMRSQTDLHPLLVLVAIVVGGGVGGLLGALVAIPLAGAVKVLVVEVVAPALRAQLGATPVAPERK